MSRQKEGVITVCITEIHCPVACLWCISFAANNAIKWGLRSSRCGRSWLVAFREAPGPGLGGGGAAGGAAGWRVSPPAPTLLYPRWLQG